MYALVALGLTGCPDPGDYACAQDSDCDRGGQFGRCLDDRACAYPVPEARCPSALIRSPNAKERPGECVPETDLASTTQTAEPTGTSTSDATSATAGTSDVTSASSSGGCDGPQFAEVSLDVDVLADTAEGYPLLLQLDVPDLVDLLRAAPASLEVTAANGSPLAVEWMLGEPSEPVRAWVRVPDPAEGDLQPLRIRWDGTSADPREVWADHVVVWHFDEATTADAVRGAPYGSLDGSVMPGQATPSIVGAGLQFDGIDDALRLSEVPITPGDDFTVSFWVRYDDETGDRASYFSSLSGHGAYPRCYRNGRGRATCQVLDGADSDNVGSADHDLGMFRHVALVREGTAVTFFVDGQAQGSTDQTDASLESGRNDVRLADGDWGPSAVTLDEFRVATVAHPDAWIALDASIHRDPAGIVTAVQLACD